MQLVRLRNYAPEDRAALAALRRDAQAQALLLAHPEARSNVDDVDDWLARRLADADGRFWIVSGKNGEALGFVQLTALHRLDRHARFGIVLDAARRGMGIGGQALEAMIAQARNIGLRKLMCEVRADNGRAIALYRRLGFREAGRLLAHYDDGERRWDVVLMEHLLDEAAA